MKIVPILEKWWADLKIMMVDCAQTGLVCLTGLDTSSTVRSDTYLATAEEFGAMLNA